MKKIDKWMILLNYDEVKIKNIEKILPKYDMLILDPDNHPDFKHTRQDALIIGYISIGEAEGYRKYWKSIEKDKNLVIKENENWKENYYVDVTSEKWHKIILDEVIPDIVKQGFDGLFLDTIDTVDVIEEKYSIKYPNARKGMIDLIKKIRKKYPYLIIISNNGLTVMDDIQNSLDGVLVESLFGTYESDANNASKIKYVEIPDNIAQEKVQKLQAIKNNYKDKFIFVIDYAEQKNKGYREYLAKKIKKHDFSPYIAERELDNIYE